MRIIEKIKTKASDIYANEPVTIAFLGDSVTQGCFGLYMPTDTSIETYFNSEEAYHTKLRKLLGMLYPNVPVNIINAGISGGRATEGLKRLERDVLRYSPDMCVVCFGLNDCGDGKIDEYTNALGELFDKLLERNIEVIFMTPNIMCTEISCHIEKPLIRETAERIMKNQINGTLEKHLEEAKRVAEKRNIPVCDCYSKWKKMNDNGVDTTSLLANYINHPLPEMHWLFAYSILETMFEK